LTGTPRPTTATKLAPAPPALRTAPAVRAPAPRVGDGGPTLDRAITQTWEGLVAGRAVGCLICGSERGMAPRYGASGPAPVGGRCTDCGSTLG
jgi:hypothetical protein